MSLRFKILVNALSVLAVLAALISGTTWYATSVMTEIDTNYSRFLDHDATAWAMAGRLNGQLAHFQMLGYAIIAETSAAEMRKTVPEFAETIEGVLQVSKTMKDKVPGHAAEIAALEDQIKALPELMRPVIELGLGNANDKALELLHGRVDSELNRILLTSGILSEKLQLR